MPKKTLLSCLILFTALILITCGQASDQKVDTTDTAEAETALTETATPAETPSLLAEWNQLPKGESPGGGLIIRDDGTYTRWDDHPDVKGASVTGPYEVDLAVTPHTLDLCVGECGAPGSEWTTLFCIFQLHGADTLEVRFAPDGNRRDAFVGETDQDTYFYTRKAEAPAKE